MFIFCTQLIWADLPDLKNAALFIKQENMRQGSIYYVHNVTLPTSKTREPPKWSLKTGYQIKPEILLMIFALGFTIYSMSFFSRSG